MRLWLALFAVFSAGCFGPDLEGSVSVDGNTIYLTLENHGKKDVHLLPEACQFGAHFEIWKDEKRITRHVAVMAAGEPCTEAARVDLRPGESVTTFWVWADATPGTYEARVDYFDWEASSGGTTLGSGGQARATFTI